MRETFDLILLTFQKPYIVQGSIASSFYLDFHSALCSMTILSFPTSSAILHMTNIVVPEGPCIIRHCKATAEALRSDSKRHGDGHCTAIRAQGDTSKDVIIFWYSEKP